MKSFLQSVDCALEPLRKLADYAGAPLYDLAARLYVAYVFFNSGLGRLDSYLDGRWDEQIFLFDFEHPVPGIPPEIAAPITMIGELILPVLLALGLFGRFGAAGILIMTAVIEFTYQHSTHHILWAFLAGTIFVKGPGPLSVDHLIRKWLAGSKSRDTAPDGPAFDNHPADETAHN